MGCKGKDKIKKTIKEGGILNILVKILLFGVVIILSPLITLAVLWLAFNTIVLGNNGDGGLTKGIKSMGNLGKKK